MPRVHFLSNRKFPSKIFDPPLKNSSPSLLGKEFKLELIFSMHLARMKKRNWIVSYYFPPRYIYETYEKFELFSFLFFNPGTSGFCNIYFCNYVLWYNNVGNIKFGSTFNKVLQKKYLLILHEFYYDTCRLREERKYGYPIVRTKVEYFGYFRYFRYSKLHQISREEQMYCIKHNYATYVQSLTFIYLAEDAVEYFDVRIIVNCHCVQQLCAIVCRFLC